MDESSDSNKQNTSADEEQQSGAPPLEAAEQEAKVDSVPDADLRQRVRALEDENRKMQNSFNAQRAKLKELFVQKERELDELKTKLAVAEFNAQEEISSLQQLVQDTVEESSNSKVELDNLSEEINRLSQENRQLQESLQVQGSSTASQELSSLAPQVLNQVKKTLARKLGGDSTTVAAQETAVDDGKSKPEGKYSHEDSEVLGSIVMQLQEETKALKEKLREADEKLRTFHSEVKDNETVPLPPCNNCINLEETLNECKENKEKMLENFEKAKKQLDDALNDLEKEANLRTGLENQWQEKREAHKKEVHVLREQVTGNEQKLLELQQQFLETRDEVSRHLLRITDEREKVNKQLEILQADNDFLSGRYLATAEQIENQYINLPNTVEDLHEVILRQQNELIQARLGCDYEKKRCVTSLDEIQILRDQLDASISEKAAYKKKYQTEIKSLQDRITHHFVTLQNCESSKVALERKESELNKQISQFRVEIIELQEQNEKLSRQLVDAKSKIKNLQEDLATSEQVQKDFVQLSQTLQMSLEQLRHADLEVRWQDDDDVANCPSCNKHFTVTVRKLHCRHCGHIYCDKCLNKTVPSGPRKRPARVCDICHTLLTPNEAPYFSQESASQQQQQLTSASNNT